jgi:soluble lytic murein transglycosylase-like protein
MAFPRISLAVLTSIWSLACLAETPIYAFVDDEGGMYLSNVPDDGRYQVLIGPTVSANGATREAPFSPPREVPSSPGNRQQYGAVVEQTAGRFGIDPALLHAVISVESGYDTNALSRRGAGGLMQLMPETAKRYGVANVFDPVDNVRGGARYLAELLKMFENDLQLALAAYNAGEAAVLKYGKHVPPYRETVAYVAKVVDSYNKYRPSM